MIKKELYDDLFFNDKTSYKDSSVFFLLIPSIKTVWIIGFSNTLITRLLFSILTVTSLKKPELYNFFKISFIEFSSKDLLSVISEKTNIVSIEILSLPLTIIFS